MRPHRAWRRALGELRRPSRAAVQRRTPYARYSITSEGHPLLAVQRHSGPLIVLFSRDPTPALRLSPPPPVCRSWAEAEHRICDPVPGDAQLLGVKNLHQPFGLTSPWTILHVPLPDALFPGMNCWQASHSCVPCGLSSYCAVALGIEPACAGALAFNMSPPRAAPLAITAPWRKRRLREGSNVLLVIRESPFGEGPAHSKRRAGAVTN